MAAPFQSVNRFPKIAADLQKMVDQVVRVATFNVHARIEGSFRTAKTGRTYKVGSRYHQASAPGQAPAILYGTLANSTRAQFPKPMLGIVSTSDAKAPHLEYGTTKMAARPSFVPGLMEEKDDFAAAMRSVMGTLGR